MFLREFEIETEYTRASKTGVEHTYTRRKRMAVFRCDNCGTEFTRPRGSMSPKRLNNNYFHVCDNCDSKRFAQKRGVERKQVWNLTASSSIPVSKL